MPFSDMLNLQAKVMRRDDTDEGMGPSNDSGLFSVEVADAVPCRVAQQSARARFRSKQDGKDAIISTLTIFTEYREDLKSRDRFIVEVMPGVTQVFDTEDINDPGFMHHHLEFVAKRIT